MSLAQSTCLHCEVINLPSLAGVLICSHLETIVHFPQEDMQLSVVRPRQDRLLPHVFWGLLMLVLGAEVRPQPVLPSLLPLHEVGPAEYWGRQVWSPEQGLPVPVDRNRGAVGCQQSTPL